MFRKFKATNGKDVVINMALVTSIRPTDPGWVQIYIVDPGPTVIVEGSVEDFLPTVTVSSEWGMKKHGAAV